MRLSVGIEHVDDIVADLAQALDTSARHALTRVHDEPRDDAADDRARRMGRTLAARRHGQFLIDYKGKWLRSGGWPARHNEIIADPWQKRIRGHEWHASEHTFEFKPKAPPKSDDSKNGGRSNSSSDKSGVLSRL